MTSARSAWIAVAAIAGCALSGPVAAAEMHPSAEPEVIHQSWSFAGVFGHYDRAQLQRGYKVYKEVCSNCHPMHLMHFRNLGEPGGPEFSEAQVKALAASVEVEDGPNDNGEMFTRPAKPADMFRPPFPNTQAARSANGGALPPDLSVIAKAREAHAAYPFYLEPVKWARDIISGYQEGGPDYIYALLTGYQDVPQGMTNDDPAHTPFKLAEGMNFNWAFPGNQVAMPKPLTDGLVEYTDGTPPTVDNYARDVASFLMWSAEPKLEERKRLGLRVLLYLGLTAMILGLAKRALWSRVH